MTPNFPRFFWFVAAQKMYSSQIFSDAVAVGTCRMLLGAGGPTLIFFVVVSQAMVNW